MRNCLLIFIFTIPLFGCQTLLKGSETTRFNHFLEQRFDHAIDRSPQFQTYLGIKKDYDKLDDFSEKRMQEDHQTQKDELKMLAQFDRSKLDAQGKISFDLFKKSREDAIRDFKWRYHNYPINQLFGWHSSYPGFMINMHQIANEKEAKDYISRVHAVKKSFENVIIGLKKRESMNIIPPKFVFPKVTENIQALMKGTPFDNSKEDSSLLADFKRKLTKSSIPVNQQKALLADLISALKESYLPAYQSLFDYWKKLAQKANSKDGIWKLPQGNEFYQVRLNRYTTTEMTAQEIHDLGLKEVARLRKEMNVIKNNVGYEGTLESFFKHVQNNPKMTYPNTKEGKNQFLKDSGKIIAEMKLALPKAFNVFPKADLVVKPVEPFREKSSASAFYQMPAADGSRPGIYYVNLYNMKEQPKYKMEALTYHEALPGHHMQIAIAQELKGLPRFRKYAGYTAYTEGWGLYSELLSKEMGFYKDPYSDFGRLSMEMLRAVRLVVDTGIHYKKWTRGKAIRYSQSNMPSDPNEIIRSIERYIVNPAQATSYKVGMLKILELRNLSKQIMKDKFTLGAFHDQLLKFGALPLNILEDSMIGWAKKEARL